MTFQSTMTVSLRETSCFTRFIYVHFSVSHTWGASSDVTLDLSDETSIISNLLNLSRYEPNVHFHDRYNGNFDR